MNLDSQLKVLADFFLDCAKIIFGSAVVSTLLPNASGGIPWLTVAFGVIAAATFLMAAMRITKVAEKIRL